MSETVQVTRTEVRVPHKCPVCNKTLRTLAGLKGHMRFAHGEQLVPPKQGPNADPVVVFWGKAIEGLLQMAVVSPETAKLAMEVIKLAAEQMKVPVESAETNARAAFWRAAASLLPALPAVLAGFIGQSGPVAAVADNKPA